MTLTALITGTPRKDDSPETQKANEFFERYLRENAEASETLKSMEDIIKEFKNRTPRVKKSKCIDGRTHGSKAIGYPPGVVTFSRTEGNNVDMSLSNTVFWSRVNQVVLDAKRHTPGMPAVFIALGHRSSHGQGCAAHGLDDEKALAAAAKQAAHVRNLYSPSELYVMHGMTNTDDMSEMLVFADGTAIDGAQLIAELSLRQASDVFQKEFLDRRLEDVATDRYVQGLTPRAMLEGPDAPLYRDLQTSLAMEAYLVREITRACKRPAEENAIVNPALLATIISTLRLVPDFPDSLLGALTYQIVWNTAYALYQRRRLETMDAHKQEKELNHAEELVGYGEGFELLPRNKAVLVKTGRGNDEDALRVAQKVLENNRKKNPQQHPLLVHINAEVTGELTNWDAFNDHVLSKLKTLLMPVHGVFGKDVRVLTTYSYKTQKMFYPTKIDADPDDRESYTVDVTRDLVDRNFTKPELERRENAYAQHLLSK
jgi:hypothetical protein